MASSGWGDIHPDLAMTRVLAHVRIEMKDPGVMSSGIVDLRI